MLKSSSSSWVVWEFVLEPMAFQVFFLKALATPSLPNKFALNELNVENMRYEISSKKTE